MPAKQTACANYSAGSDKPAKERLRKFRRASGSASAKACASACICDSLCVRCIIYGMYIYIYKKCMFCNLFHLRLRAAFSQLLSAVRPVRGMQMEEVALRTVYSCLWKPDRLALRASSQVHAQLPVRCEFSNKHCIWDLTLRIQGGPCRAPCSIPDGVCARCFKFSCHAHTFWLYPCLPWDFTRDLTRRSVCLRCKDSLAGEGKTILLFLHALINDYIKTYSSCRLTLRSY